MSSPSSRRLAFASALSVGLVAAIAIVPGSDPDREGSYRTAAEAQAKPALAADGHDHVHNDPKTKNAISRAALSAETTDPTTAAQARANAAYVESERWAEDPALTTAQLRGPRLAVPENRYAMAGGCYTLAGQKVRFQATDLGRYLLYSTDRKVLTAGILGNSVHWDVAPSPRGDWIVQKTLAGFTFQLDDGRRLTSSASGFVTGPTGSAFSLRTTTGCPEYPEVDTNVSGDPHAGATPFQEVRGYVDPHVHGMAFEFLGGDAHCGKPWHKYGAPSALVDCVDHTLTNGHGALMEAFLSGEPTHDPVGWPTFKDWPAPRSLTHEGIYYKWLERSWRGGQRIMTNLFVENNKLCELYPIKHNSCDDMKSIRLQAKDAYKMQDYIDAQYGGPGKGWYRIVTTPWQAREVINQGKLAIVLGIETSIPFGCTVKLGLPACTTATIDKQLDEVRALGVTQMELVNKFDNALSGVAGDGGEVGMLVNGANFLETGSFWRMQHCEPADGESHDKNQMVTVPGIEATQQDALFGAVALFGLMAPSVLPVYPAAPHCNSLGLTSLGTHLINRMAEKHMLFDPDHMSVKSRNAALTQLEALNYPGVVSSHSWSTPDAYPRIYKLGGFIAPYAGDSTGFYAKWQRHLGWADSRYYFGFGYGADINGLGAQGDPRGAGVPNPVTYPFTGLNGVQIDKNHSGERVYDINVDGVAHYGLYPDWVEDLRRVAGPEDAADIGQDLARGAEAYLQTWERAEGIAPDSCRNAGLRKTVANVQTVVRQGMTTLQVMRAVGQPYTRLGSTYGVCAKTLTEARVPMTITFGSTGRVVNVRRS
jgi:hypothetical protein